jgi:hypothetical protein
MSSSQGSRALRWLLAVSAVVALAAAGVVAWPVWPRPEDEPAAALPARHVPWHGRVGRHEQHHCGFQSDAAGRIGQVIRSLAAGAPPPGD